MKAWIIPLIIAGMFSGCARVRPPLVEEDSSGVRTTIRAIWEAAKTFYCDKGKWPTSVEDLLQAHYLEIDSSVQEQWRFRLIGGPPQEIRAISTEPIKEEGEGLLKTVSYDVRKGWWKGYGIPRYGTRRLTLPEQAELTRDVVRAIESIRWWSYEYYKDKGSWPETVAELEDDHYIELDIGVDSTWQFAIIGSPPQAIVAISKKDMPEGAGWALEFDIATGVWRGYGQP